MSTSGQAYANAEPTKRLFIDLLTRDISLEHAILDLIDNSINSAIRERRLDLAASFDDFIGPGTKPANEKSVVEISYSSNEFKITDDCGGIELEAAKNTVFRFGRGKSAPTGDMLSVYGLGLKRALFKIGDDIKVSSQTKQSAFVVEFSASDWPRATKMREPTRMRVPTKMRQPTRARIMFGDFHFVRRREVQNYRVVAPL
jgi:Histidine kinase-, DNA gyrase B-, and HSP90-like ATPase